LIWSQIEFKERWQPQVREYQKTIWREIRRPQEKKIVSENKFNKKNQENTISKRKQNTLVPKSCVSASSQGICEAPSPRAILGERIFFQNHTFLLPVRIKLELIL
jgi:hypothetical protein